MLKLPFISEGFRGSDGVHTGLEALRRMWIRFDEIFEKDVYAVVTIQFEGDEGVV